MAAAYSMGPQDLNDRKQALIKKLSGQSMGGGGGASRLSNGMPFGALPRLGFSPNVRSVFGRPNEQFNFSGQAPGIGQALSRLTGPSGQAAQGDQPTGGVGPASGGGGSPGLPQQPGTQYSTGDSGGTQHLLEGAGLGASAQGGQLPGNVQQFLEGGALSGGVAEWLKQNPWALGALGGSSGGPVL